MKDKFEEDVLVFKAFCDINRLQIIKLLQSGEKCACVLLDEIDIVQSTLSHHMKILCQSGVVSSRKDGKWIYYSLNEQGIQYAGTLLIDYTRKLGSGGEYKCK